MDETITAQQILLPATEPSGTFRFERARYDEVTDVLHLETGPPEASSAEFTPEGHALRISAADNRIIGLQISGARGRLRNPQTRIEVTVGPNQLLVLDVRDVRSVIGGGRFGRLEGAHPVVPRIVL